MRTKKIKYILISILTLITILSCDLFSKIENNTTNDIEIKLSFNTTATKSNGDIYPYIDSSYIGSIIATFSDGTTDISITDNDDTLSLELSEGTWNITANVYTGTDGTGNLMATGTNEITVVSGTSYYYLTLTPYQVGTGDLSLDIEWDSSSIPDGIITSVTTSVDGVEAETTTSDSFTQEYSYTIYTFKQSDLSSGSHTVNMQFKNSSDTLIYSIVRTVHIYDYWTTDGYVYIYSDSISIPDAPYYLGITVGDYNELTLDWDNSGDATGYNIYKYVADDLSATYTADATDSTYTDSSNIGVIDYETITYIVEPYNSNGSLITSSDMSTLSGVTGNYTEVEIDYFIPTDSSGSSTVTLTATSSTPTTIDLNWNSFDGGTDVDHYEIWYQSDIDNSWTTITITDLTTITDQLTGLSSAYYYDIELRVVAANGIVTYGEQLSVQTSI